VTSPLTLIQISDLHLCDDSCQIVRGVDVEASFDATLNHLCEHYPTTDAVVVSGDLTHDASASTYRRLAQKLQRLNSPIHLLPGNHDEIELIHAITNNQLSSAVVADYANWRLIMLDTSLTGCEHGTISTVSIKRLQQSLGENPEQQVMIFLHHHPVASGSAWLDTVAIENPERLFALLKEYPQVRAISWGHTHQAFEGVQNGIRLFSAPATCTQFKPNCHDFTIDNSADSGRPGYRWFRLYENGEIGSGVERVTI